MMREVTGLSNSDLMAAFELAKDDLSNSAASSPNSEWHQACFAAVYMYAMEMERRGLFGQTVH